MNSKLAGFLYAVKQRYDLLREHEDDPIDYDPCGDAENRRNEELAKIDAEVERYFQAAVNEFVSMEPAPRPVCGCPNCENPSTPPAGEE